MEVAGWLKHDGAGMTAICVLEDVWSGQQVRCSAEADRLKVSTAVHEHLGRLLAVKQYRGATLLSSSTAHTLTELPW